MPTIYAGMVRDKRVRYSAKIESLLRERERILREPYEQEAKDAMLQPIEQKITETFEAARQSIRELVVDAEKRWTQHQPIAMQRRAVMGHEGRADEVRRALVGQPASELLAYARLYAEAKDAVGAQGLRWALHDTFSGGGQLDEPDLRSIYAELDTIASDQTEPAKADLVGAQKEFELFENGGRYANAGEEILRDPLAALKRANATMTVPLADGSRQSLNTAEVTRLCAIAGVEAAA